MPTRLGLSDKGGGRAGGRRGTQNARKTGKEGREKKTATTTTKVCLPGFKALSTILTLGNRLERRYDELSCPARSGLLLFPLRPQRRERIVTGGGKSE